MKRLCLVLMVLAVSCWGLEQWQVRYVGGTLDNSKVGAVGGLNLSSPGAMAFQAGDFKIAIPYDQILSYQYRTDVTHHLGVLPAIAVGLLKQRQHKHVFTIVYLDERNAKQIAVFEVPKQAAPSVQAVLDAKGVHSCLEYEPCNGKSGTRSSSGPSTPASS